MCRHIGVGFKGFSFIYSYAQLSLYTEDTHK